MGVYINMEMPKDCRHCRFMYQQFGELHDKVTVVYMCTCCSQGTAEPEYNNTRAPYCPLVELLPHGRQKKRVVYRGDVYNALESARIIALDGILTDRYKNGFHDGLKRALVILANEVQDVPTIIPAETPEEEV